MNNFEHTNQQDWSSQRTTLKGRALDKTDGPEKEGRNDADQSSSNKVLPLLIMNRTEKWSKTYTSRSF